MDKSPVTVEHLRSVLSYDKETGLFTWIRSNNNRIKVGDVAGSRDKHGYVHIRISMRYYMAHRLAWLYAYGVWPSGDIDHIDGNPANSSLSNLRDVSRTMNMQNQRRAQISSRTGLLGAWFDKKYSRWQSQITLPGGKRKHLGYFNSADAAHAAYVAAKRQFHVANTM